MYINSDSLRPKITPVFPSFFPLLFIKLPGAVYVGKRLDIADLLRLMHDYLFIYAPLIVVCTIYLHFMLWHIVFLEDNLSI